MKLSHVDDRINGTDLVIIRSGLNKAGNLAIFTTLGIDLTFSRSGFREKIADIVYKLTRYPELVRVDVFVDEKTGAAGSRLVPKIALFDSIENLERRINAWGENNGIESETDLTQLEYLLQALVQVRIFANLCNTKSPDNSKGELKKYYRRNYNQILLILKEKIKQLQQWPQNKEIFSILAGVLKTDSERLKSILCARDDNTDPILHRIVWSY